MGSSDISSPLCVTALLCHGNETDIKVSFIWCHVLVRGGSEIYWEATDDPCWNIINEMKNEILVSGQHKTKLLLGCRCGFWLLSKMNSEHWDLTLCLVPIISSAVIRLSSRLVLVASPYPKLRSRAFFCGSWNRGSLGFWTPNSTFSWVFLCSSCSNSFCGHSSYPWPRILRGHRSLCSSTIYTQASGDPILSWGLKYQLWYLQI